MVAKEYDRVDMSAALIMHRIRSSIIHPLLSSLTMSDSALSNLQLRLPASQLRLDHNGCLVIHRSVQIILHRHEK